MTASAVYSNTEDSTPRLRRASGITPLTVKRISRHSTAMSDDMVAQICLGSAGGHLHSSSGDLGADMCGICAPYREMSRAI